MTPIPLFKVHMPPREALLPALESVLYSGQIGEGPQARAFEQRFGERIGNPRCLAFSSGTAALHTALLLAGVGAGDEVVSTAMTAEPTNLAILHAGAQPVWADVDPANGNLNPVAVRERIGPRTRAIVVVHYGGVPAPLAALRAIAAEHGVALVEDAAHALGARYAGQPIGQDADFAMFSLQAIKHLTTVDGGMLACRDEALLARGRRLRWFGIDRTQPRTEVDVAEAGFKYHMNDVTATIGLVQLEHIGPVLERHAANGRFLDTALAGIPGLEPCRFEAAAEPAYWFYTVLAEDRDGLARRLAEAGIAASTVHKRNDHHSVFAASRAPLPGLDSFAARMLHLPCGWWVDDAARSRIVDTIRRGW